MFCHPHQEEGDPGRSSLALPRCSSASAGNYDTKTVAINSIDPGTYLVLQEVEGECKISKEFIARILYAETQEILNKILHSLEEKCDVNKTKIVSGVYHPNGHVPTSCPKLSFNGPLIKLDVMHVDSQRGLLPCSQQADVSIIPKDGKIFSEKEIKQANDMAQTHPELSLDDLLPTHDFRVYNLTRYHPAEVSFAINASRLNNYGDEPTTTVTTIYSTKFGMFSKEQRDNQNTNTNKLWTYRYYIKSRLKDVNSIIKYLAEKNILTQDEVQNLLGQQNTPAQVAELLSYLIHRDHGDTHFLDALMLSDFKSNHNLANTLRDECFLYRETTV